MKRLHDALGTALVLSLALTLTAGCAQMRSAAEHQPDEAAGYEANDEERTSNTDRTNSEDRVAIGYGEVEKDYVTGSVGVVTREQMDRRKVTDTMQLLEGRIAGVRVVQTPDGPRLRIRGMTSFMGSNDPLIVLDGSPLPPGSSGSLRFLNPNDIERIDVLKGASAAIYGSRGANGVVLITTRR